METNWKLFGQTHETEYQLARRRTYLKIDLDQLTKNVNILRNLCSDHTEVIGVVKGNAYGHGSVEVCRHLSRHGINHFAVASPWEGIELRKAGIGGFIQIFGNACEEEIPDFLEYDLTPTVCSTEFLTAWVAQIRQNREHCPGNILSPFEEEEYGSVVVKLDTGMSRNGCQSVELDSIMDFCEEHNIHVHSIMTHFAQAWDDPDFTNEQLEIFLRCTRKYRERGVKLHAANSAGTLLGYGTDLDFIRPGIAMYGLPPGTSEEETVVGNRIYSIFHCIHYTTCKMWKFNTTEDALQLYTELGLKPVLTWLAKPNHVKVMSEGKRVGYDQTYRCKEGEVVATFSIGYADGYNRLLSSRGIITTIHGTPVPVIGRVSMDAITVSIPEEEKDCREFYIIKDDFTSPNSIVELSKQLKTITYEVPTCFAARLARIYKSDDHLLIGPTHVR